MSDCHKQKCIEQGKQIALLEAELARVRDDNHKQWRRSIQLENDVMNDKVQLDFVAHDYQKKINELKKQVERLKGALTEIHQNGGVCTDEDGCPICVAEKALSHKQGEGKG